MKLNKKGFVLAETLVVAVFMATIFTIIYVNFYPLIGEYEKREFYDDLDSKYDIYWFKRLVQNKQALPKNKWAQFTGAEYNANCDSDKDGYCDYDKDGCLLRDRGYVNLKGGANDLCSNLNPNSSSGVNFQVLCNNLENRTEITKLYLTTYYLNDPAEMSSAGGQQKVYKNHSNYFKNKVEAGGFDFDENFKDYVFYLPDFRYASPNGARFRLIAQFKRHTHKGYADDIEYYSYATIEVNREKGV